MPRSYLIVDDFAAEAAALRRHFEERFADPRTADAGRFVWDYWHVPGQYTALRTPAWRFFPKTVYESFHRRLVHWGRETLGCHDISPPWLSMYVSGCRQEWHGDLPHGPWAFVFSLAPRKPKYRGGETLMLRDETLEYWTDFVSERGVEENRILRAVPPRQNRLLVFDPRLPHAVRRVEGVDDPRDARLVINGWFVQPRPFIHGPLKSASVDRLLAVLGEDISTAAKSGTFLAGLLSLRLAVRSSGEVAAVEILSDTLRADASRDAARRAFVRRITETALAFRFPRLRAAARLTLPIILERRPPRASSRKK